jgi:hypothetical protein
VRSRRATLGDDGVVAAFGWADGGEPTFVPGSSIWVEARNRDGAREARA